MDSLTAPPLPMLHATVVTTVTVYSRYIFRLSCCYAAVYMDATASAAAAGEEKMPGRFYFVRFIACNSNSSRKRSRAMGQSMPAIAAAATAADGSRC